MTTFNTSAYVETDALLGWKAEMSSLNDEAKEKISEISTILTSLDSSWKGDSAEGYSCSMSQLLESIVGKHTEMSDIENFLSIVVNTMENH